MVQDSILVMEIRVPFPSFPNSDRMNRISGRSSSNYDIALVKTKPNRARLD